MLEQTILGALSANEKYMRKVYPFLNSTYFAEKSDRVIFEIASSFIDEFNTAPSKDVMLIQLKEVRGITDKEEKEIADKIKTLSYDDTTDEDWLVKKTEQFCKDKAVFNAVKESILIIDGENKKLDRGAIPQILSDALAVSFDTNIGHSFLEDFNARFDFYHTKENKIEFDIDILNKITKGGVSRKALCCAMASTGVGKSLAMCHFAAANLMSGYNVLYITMEMAEERIAERIDANLLDFTLDELREVPRDVYASRIGSVMKQTTGKLIIKEYPTSSANANHFRYLMNELKLKKKFIPDIVYIDYLNICASSRVKMSGSVNSYTYIKSIAEELRGLAVEFNVPIFTATQSNRDGANNSDIDLTNTSESFGLPATVDFMIALMSTEELEQSGQILFKQLKNRWGDISTNKKFVVGIDRSKMRLYNIDNPTEGLIQDTPAMDKTTFGQRDSAELSFGKKKGKKPAFDGDFQ